jgi:RNA polymerase sigma-70 factor (ECF subfamily)
MLIAEDEITNEASTVLAAISGDAAAFTLLFRRYHPMIYAYSYRLCLNAADAHDIAQETFIKAARALPEYRPACAFHYWLYQICTNAARDWQRSRGRRLRREEEAAAGHDSHFPERPADLELAREALAQLSDDLRAAVVLVFFEEMTHAEAARVLGCAETTISWRIFKAKRKLKQLLQSHE